MILRPCGHTAPYVIEQSCRLSRWLRPGSRKSHIVWAWQQPTKIFPMTLKALLAAKDNHIAILEEKLRIASLKQFGASSEKANDDQLALFNEAEEAASAPDDASGADAVNVTVVGEHTRKTPGRKPLPDHLPRTRIEHDIAEADKVCGCSYRKTKIGEEVSERLDIIPAQIQVLQHVRFKYACRAREGTDDDGPTVMTAAMPPQPIPKSNASPGLLAYIVIAKFCDGLPLYRLEKMFPRIGVVLLRAMDDPMWRSHRSAHRKDACHTDGSRRHPDG